MRADRSGSTNLNSEISGNPVDIALTGMVRQAGVNHVQAEQEGRRCQACTQATHRRIQSAGALKRDPTKKARRWVAEVAHSWFNRLRKLLVRYEKLERSFLPLNHLTASIIAFRKIKLDVNMIYG